MPHPDDATEQEPRPMPAEFQYLLIVAVLFALLLLAGLPGHEPPTAGERNLQPPRREWATRWATQVQAEQDATVATQPAATDAGATPSDPSPQR